MQESACQWVVGYMSLPQKEKTREPCFLLHAFSFPVSVREGKRRGATVRCAVCRGRTPSPGAMAAPSYVHSDHGDGGPARPGLVSSTRSLSCTAARSSMLKFPYTQNDMALEPQCRKDTDCSSGDANSSFTREFKQEASFNPSSSSS